MMNIKKLIISVAVSAVLQFGLVYLGGIQAGAKPNMALLATAGFATLLSIGTLLKESPLVDVQVSIPGGK
jgi:hypothetical protein